VSQDAEHRFGVGDQDALGDLQFQTTSQQAGLNEHGMDQREETRLPKLQRRKVDGNRQFARP
jgi:hypothetical protein